MTTQNTAQLRLRRSQRVRVLHPLATAFDWRFAVYACFVVLAVILVFQAPSAVNIAVGSLGDRLFLQSSAGLSAQDAQLWYGDELSADAASGRSRWTRATAHVVIPAFDQHADVSFVIRMAGWPSDVRNTRTSQPQVHLDINDHEIAVFTPTTTFDDYYFVLPAAQNTYAALDMTIRVSDVFTATTAYQDVRPKGVRVERIAAATPNDWVALTMPHQSVVSLGFLYALLWYVIAIMLVRRVSVALMTSLGVVTVTIILMAFERVYVMALLPWLMLGLVGWCVWLLRSDIARMWYALYRAYARGAAIGCGLWVAVSTVIAYYMLRLPIPQFVSSPLAQYGVYVVSAALVLLVGIFVPLRRPLQWGIQAWIKHSAILTLLVLVAAVSGAGYVLMTAPFIGHADYADNVVVARNILAGRGWVVDYVSQFYRLYPSVTHSQETWPLLQPVWIVGAFVLAGANDMAARLPNLVFYALLLWLIAQAARRIWDARVGVVAIIIIATNAYLFRQLEYATTDLAFVVFTLGSMLAVYDMRAASFAQATPRRWYQTRLVQVVRAGIWTGLMLLQKPGSGGVLAFGMGIWLLYDYRDVLTQPLITTRLDRLRANIRAFGKRIWPVMVWALIALLCVAPYVEYNMRLYGSPAHTTEQFDAWLLEYTQWDAIYRVYAPDNGIGSGDLPNRSWVLRWGYDAVAHKVVNQFTALRNYIMPSLAAWPVMWHGFGAAPDAKSLMPALWVWCMLIGLFVWHATSQSMLKRLFMATFTPYVLFMATYWHANEPRYWVVVLPWMALLAAAAVVAGIDRSAQWFGGRLLAPFLVAVVFFGGMSAYDSLQNIMQRQRIDTQMVAADRDMYDYLRQKTPLNAVMMTRVPWQLNWYAQRPAVMIPADADANTLLRIAKHYQARYLVLDSLQRPNAATRARIDEMLQTYQFVEVYRTPAYRVDDLSGAYTMQSVVYEFPIDYAGVADIR